MEKIDKMDKIDKRIGYRWWPNQTGNRDDRLYTLRELFEDVDTEHYNNCDFILNAVPRNIPEGPYTYTQLCGFGENSIIPEGRISGDYIQGLNDSDKLIFLDPVFLESLDEIDDRFLKRKSITLPLGRRHITFDYDDLSKDSFTVFNPAGDWKMKEPEKFVEAAKILHDEVGNEIEFIQTTKSPTWNNDLDWLGVQNLTVLPRIDYKSMCYFYRLSDIIAPFSSAETFGNSIMESFRAGKPTIMNESGLTLTISEEYIDEMIEDFGTDIIEFDERWKDEYHSGDHYLQAESSEELADRILDIYSDYEKYKEMGKRAYSWTEKWWTQKDRFGKLNQIDDTRLKR